MIAAGVSVPDGFAVTTDAYAEHLQIAGRLRGRIRSPDAVDRHRQCRRRRGKISRDPPADRLGRDARGVEAEIRRAYRAMRWTTTICRLRSALRRRPRTCRTRASPASRIPISGSSATMTSSNGSRPAGPACSTPARSPTARRTGFGWLDAQMAVGVQKMVDAAAAGVAMTLDPINGDRTKIVIDAAFGLGEPVVSGEITPDNFVVEKVLLEILKRKIANKDQELVADRAARRTVHKVVETARRDAALAERCAGHCGRARSPRRSKEHGLPAGRRVGDRSRSAGRRKRRHAAKPAGDGLEPEEGGAAKRPMRWASRACSARCSRRSGSST